MKNEYRKDLPPIPERIRRLPVVRGYPVPWFVAKIKGEYDFRVADQRKFTQAINQRLCWVYGQKLGTTLAFTIGPMCAVNRITSEPPEHRECAEFSATACPFLVQKEKGYRHDNLPDGMIQPAGHHIERQPGAVCIWLTHKYKLVKAPGGTGFLFSLGDPVQVLWFSHGRGATRAEILESVESGLPILQDMAKQEGRAAEWDLDAKIKIAYKLFPPDVPTAKPLFGSAARRGTHA